MIACVVVLFAAQWVDRHASYLIVLNPKCEDVCVLSARLPAQHTTCGMDHPHQSPSGVVCTVLVTGMDICGTKMRNKMYFQT